MQKHQQLSLEVPPTTPQQVEPIDLSDPTLTLEQDAQYDVLVDNCAFTRAEALSRIGAGPVGHETEFSDAEPTSAQTSTVKTHLGAWKNDA